MKKKAVILYNEVLTNNPDELDVINQRDLVKDALEKLNYEVKCLTVGKNIADDIEKIFIYTLKQEYIFLFFPLQLF